MTSERAAISAHPHPSSPASAARSLVAALRPSGAHSTRCPAPARHCPTAAPISPGCSSPIVRSPMLPISPAAGVGCDRGYPPGQRRSPSMTTASLISPSARCRLSRNGDAGPVLVALRDQGPCRHCPFTGRVPSEYKTRCLLEDVRCEEQEVPKLVYDFTEGNKDLKDLLGGKGANLAEMTNLGLPVPPGFVITTEACRYYLEQGSTPKGLDDEIAAHLDELESAMGRKLGDPADPLLVSVRSGAKFSMPGMMETVLNIGLSDESVQGLAKQAGNERFAWDSYRRLLQMFGKTVLDIEGEHFEHAIDEAKQAKGVRNDLDLDANDLQNLVEVFKA